MGKYTKDHFRWWNTEKTIRTYRRTLKLLHPLTYSHILNQSDKSPTAACRAKLPPPAELPGALFRTQKQPRRAAQLSRMLRVSPAAQQAHRPPQSSSLISVHRCNYHELWNTPSGKFDLNSSVKAVLIQTLWWKRVCTLKKKKAFFFVHYSQLIC